MDKTEEQFRKETLQLIDQKNIEIDRTAFFKICYICRNVFPSHKDKNLLGDKNIEEYPIIWANTDEELNDKATQDNDRDYSIIVRNRRKQGVPICSEKCLSTHNL